MYAVVIQVPIYRDGPGLLLATDWRRSVLLLRDSLEGKLGRLVVLAPSLPVSEAKTQAVEPLGADGADITLLPSFDARCRARHFWLRDRRRWIHDIRGLLPEAKVVHAGLDDVYRPISYAGHTEAVRAGVPTVFVQDTDIVYRCQQLAAGAPLGAKIRLKAYGTLFERMCRRGVATASLSLLKGRAVMDRYGPYARNMKGLHDTSHSLADIVAPERVEARLARSAPGRGLRLVYCGRFVERKGVADSIDLVAAARALGAEVWLDLIGSGPEGSALEAQVSRLGLGDRVRFLGQRRYSAELIAELAEYDAILFTPRSEDTPRMIFDGYAAGLPLIGVDIPYVRERHEEEGTCILLPAADRASWAHVMARLAAEPGRLAAPTRAALKAADFHACERWYQRRAQWTFEAVGLKRGLKLVGGAAAPQTTAAAS